MYLCFKAANFGTCLVVASSHGFSTLPSKATVRESPPSFLQSTNYESIIVILSVTCIVPKYHTVRPDMRYCFRSGRFRPNPRTKHISVPPRHMTKSYIPGFNMISQHYKYKGYNNSYNRHTSALIQYNIGRYMSEYRLQSMPSGKSKTH